MQETVKDIEIRSIMDGNLFKTLCPEMVRCASEILDEMIDEGICGTPLCGLYMVLCSFSL